MTHETTGGRTASVDAAIHQAARKSFIEQGPRKTTIASIARDARVSRPTIYARYASVEQALANVLRAEGMKILESVPQQARTVDEIVECALIVEETLRTNELYSALISSDPKLFTFAMFQNPAEPQVLAAQHFEHLILQVQAIQEAAEYLDGARRIRHEDARKMSVMLLYMVQTAAFSVRALGQELGSFSAAREECAVQIRNYLTEC